MLSRNHIEQFLTSEQRERFFFEEVVDSTNTQVKQLVKEANRREIKDGTFFVANGQTGGRGRLGRTFQSEKNQGIYLSMLLTKQEDIQDVSEITAWVAVTVARAIKRVTGIEMGIKWVNDLVVQKRKLAGILTELVYDEEKGVYYVIIGIGINVHYNEKSFSKEINQIATSLDLVTKKRVSRLEVLKALMYELEQLRMHWPKEKDKYLEQYRKLCITTGKEVQVMRQGEQRIGIAKEVTDCFQLKIEYEDGSTEVVSSGEVSIRGLYGYV